jgi:hypothetical protein
MLRGRLHDEEAAAPHVQGAHLQGVEGGAQQKGGRASISGAEVDRNVPEEIAGGGRMEATTLKEEEAAQELSWMQQRMPSAVLARSLPTAVPLKTSFSTCLSEK